MDRDFETEVLTRLTKIETKLDDYKSVKDKSEEAYDLSRHNRDRIEKLEDNNKWAFRTAIGAIITNIVSIAFLLMQTGIGGK